MASELDTILADTNALIQAPTQITAPQSELDRILGPAPQQFSTQRSALDQILAGDTEPSPPVSTGFGSQFAGSIERLVGPEFTGVQAIFNAAVGDDEDARRLALLAQEEMAEISERRPRIVPTVEQAFESPSNFAIYASETLGEGLGTVATVIAGGGAGGILARLVGRGLLPQTVAKIGARKLAQRGIIAGVVSTSTVLNTGETTNRLFDATGQLQPGVAIPAGAIKGALDAVAPGFLIRKFGFGDTLAKNFISRVEAQLAQRGLRGFAAGGLALGAGEAVTETLQEATDAAAQSFVDDNFDVLSAEQISNFLNAASAGLLVGGVFGASVGAFTGAPQPQRAATEAELTRAAGLRTEAEPSRPGPSAVAAPEFQIPQRAEPIAVQPPVSSLRSTTAIVPPVPGAVPTVRFGESEPGEFQVSGLEALDPQLAANLPPLEERTARVRVGDTPVLLTPEAAQRTLVAEGGTPSIRGAALQEVDIASVDPANLTLFVEELPTARGRVQERVTFAEGTTAEAQSQALERLEKAVSALRSVRQRTATGAARQAVQVQLQRAQEAYQQAIDFGLRVAPLGTESAQVIGDPPVGVPITEFPPAEGVLPRFRTPGLRSETRFPRSENIALGPNGEFVLGNRAKSTLPRFAARTLEARRANFTATPQDFIRHTIPTIEVVVGQGAAAIRARIGAVFTFRGQPLTAEQELDVAGRLFGGESREVVYEDLLREGFRVEPTRGRQADFVPEFGLELGELPDGFVEVPVGITTDVEENIFGRPGAGVVQEVLGKIPAGTVTVVGDQISSLAPQQLGYSGLKADLPKALKILEQFLKRIMPQQRILFGLGTGNIVAETGFASDPTVRGSYRSMAGTVGMIQLQPDLIKSKLDLVRVLTHEFGHMIAHKVIQAKGPGTVERLYRAYDRSLLAAQQSGAQVPLAIFSPQRMLGVLDRLAESGHTTIAGYARDPLTDPSDKTWLDYAASFDEWFAEQVAKWAVTNTAPLSIIQTVFRDFASAMKRLARDIGKAIGLKLSGPEAFRPEVVVEEFLNSTLNNWVKPNVLPVGPLAQMGATEASIAEHTAAFGDQLPPGGGRADSAASEPPNRVIDRAGSPIDRKRRKAENARFNWFIKHAWGIQQLARKNVGVQSLQSYTSLLSQWYNRKMQWMVRADGRLREWQALGTEQAEALGEFLFRLDQFGIDKKRFPSEEEFIALARQHKLTDQAIEVYRKIVGDFSSVLDHMERILILEANKIADPVKRAERVDEIQAEFLSFDSRPYFPHSRFGKFVLVVKRAGVTEYMEAFEDKKARDRAVDAVRRRFPQSQGFTLRRDVLPDEVQALRILPPSMLKMIRDKVQLSPQQQQWFDDLLFQLAPAQSFRKRFATRDNVPGFSVDAPRAYANYFFHGANHFARIEFSGPLQDAINEANEEVNALSGVDEINLDKMRGIVSFMQDHFDNSLYAGGDWAGIRSVAFSWHIGAVPASAFVNLTQVPMVTLPYLAARYEKVLGRGRSDAAAAAAIARGYRDIRSMMLRPDRLSTQDAKFLSRAVNEGFIDESFAAELAGLSEGGTIQRMLPGTRTGRMIRDAGYLSSWLFQNAERVNRRVTFRAATELALRNPEAEYLAELRQRFPDEIASLQRDGFSPVEALAFLAGKDAVQQTQFEYAAWAQPRFMRGPVKRTIFTFYAFLQNMLWFAQNSPGRGRYMLLMLSVAGLQGLPGAEDIEDFVRFAARQMGIDFNPEKEVREFLVELDVNPDLVLRGVSRTGFGLPQVADLFGVPLPELDLSRRIGLGRVIPGIEALSEGEFDRIISRGTTDIAGASFAIGFNVIQALSDDHPDVFKRWERALPSALRNVSRAWRFHEEERERTRGGETVLEFDPSDPRQQAEIIAQGLGFQPTRLAERWNKLRLQQEVIRYWEIRKNVLLAKFRHAHSMADRGLRAETLQAVKRYNTRVPDATMKIGRDSLRRSLQSAARRRARFEAGLPRTRFGAQTAREIERLFPNDPTVVDVETIR